MKSLKKLLSTVILWLLIGGLLIINISWGEGVIIYNSPSLPQKYLEVSHENAHPSFRSMSAGIVYHTH